jgi:hypothetical protein
VSNQKWPYELFGVECGQGWSQLYGPLLTLCAVFGVEVHQVKEKFGGLRFYVEGNCPEKLRELITAMESLSYHVCEVCGAPGKERPGGWIKTLCDKHAGADGE